MALNKLLAWGSRDVFWLCRDPESICKIKCVCACPRGGSRGEHSFQHVLKEASFQKCLKAQVWASFVPHHPHLRTRVPCPQHQRLTPSQATVSLSLAVRDGE